MKKKRIWIGILVVLVLAVSGAALAANGYNLPRWVIPGGGGSSNGTGYILTGAIGQPVVDVVSGGNYHLSGGFWAGGAGSQPPAFILLYLPVIIR